MKIANSRAAAKRYRLVEDSYGLDPYPAVPDDYGPVHALLFDASDDEKYWSHARRWIESKAHEVAFLESSELEAACGRSVRLVFPVRFDTEEDDACRNCIAMAELWLDDRAEYERVTRERTARRRAKEQERQEYLDYQRQHMGGF